MRNGLFVRLDIQCRVSRSCSGYRNEWTGMNSQYSASNIDGAPMSDIFISHIHEDEIAAAALSRFLEAKCKAFHYEPPPNIFVSSSGLQLGDEWLDKIRVALKSAKIVIALFSPEAVSRP